MVQALCGDVESAVQEMRSDVDGYAHREGHGADLQGMRSAEAGKADPQVECCIGFVRAQITLDGASRSLGYLPADRVLS